VTPGPTYVRVVRFGTGGRRPAGTLELPGLTSYPNRSWQLPAGAGPCLNTSELGFDWAPSLSADSGILRTRAASGRGRPRTRPPCRLPLRCRPRASSPALLREQCCSASPALPPRLARQAAGTAPPRGTAPSATRQARHPRPRGRRHDA
jgi:hypothetical protein